MAFRVFTTHIAPGKTEEWRGFIDALKGPRREEYERSLAREGAPDATSKQRAYLQVTGAGDVALYVMKGRTHVFREVFQGIGSSAEPFDVWFTERMRALHDIDLRRALNLPEAEQLGKVRLPRE